MALQLGSTYAVPCVWPADCQGRLRAQVPGSKSITNRALLLAILAQGDSVLEGVLFSQDSQHFLECVQRLGFSVEIQREDCRVKVIGEGGHVPRMEAEIYVGSAGTAARFLTAYLGITPGQYHLDASEQMRRRPMAPLLATLQELGCEIQWKGESGYFPFILSGHGFGKDSVMVDIDHSSQFLSALMMVAVLAEKGLKIQIKGHHGMSYIKMTQQMMEQFGVKVLQTAPDSFEIPGGQAYKPCRYPVEPDVSAACYFYGMAALLGIPVQVPGVHADSLQGDVEFLKVLEEMGCSLEQDPEGIQVQGPRGGWLKGVEADLSACSDQTITLAALAPFADSPTTIRGIGHIRYQESDRLAAIDTELTRLGIRCESGEDWIKIWPGKPNPGLVRTYEDHRMAMGFSLMGLRVPGIVIDDPQCCSKTFAEYFQELERLLELLKK